jgi:hypothetical protein
VHSRQQIAEKIELFVQKIFEAFLGHMATSENQLLCHLHKEAACKYVDEMDARMEGALCGTP